MVRLFFGDTGHLSHPRDIPINNIDIGFLALRLNGPCTCRSVGRSVGWLVGWLAGWLVGRSVCWLVGWSVGCSVGWLAGWLVCRSFCHNIPKGREFTLPCSHRSTRNFLFHIKRERADWIPSPSPQWATQNHQIKTHYSKYLPCQNWAITIFGGQESEMSIPAVKFIT